MNSANRWLAGLVGTALIGAATLWEGTEYKPYDDIVGVLTVCQGYTGKDIIRTKVYTKAECDYLLTTVLQKHSKAILECIKVPLTRNQYDAFVLFSYNVGSNAFCTSNTVLKPLNAGNYQLACAGLLKWTYAKGKFVQGLYNRRKYERDMCMGVVNAK